LSPGATVGEVRKGKVLALAAHSGWMLRAPKRSSARAVSNHLSRLNPTGGDIIGGKSDEG
jgi:hypothetical protein